MAHYGIIAMILEVRFVPSLFCIAMIDRISAPRLASPRLASPPLQGVVPVRDHYLFVVATLRDMPPIVRYFRYRHLEQRAIVFLCPFNENNSWEDARAAEILSLQVSATMADSVAHADWEIILFTTT